VKEPSAALVVEVAAPKAAAGKAEPPPIMENNEPVSMAASEEAPDWDTLLPRLGLTGMVRELAQHCVLDQLGASAVVLHLAAEHRHLLSRPAQDKVQAALSAHFGRPLRLAIELNTPAVETPAARDRRGRAARQAAAIEAIEGDDFVREAIDLFDAKLVDTTIRPVD
jgi:DNA polymerase-3 subunit gamma/tau